MSAGVPRFPIWMLDSSTFIHACMIDRVPLLASLRSPLHFPEYVYRWELGQQDHEITRINADKWVKQRRIAIRQLTLDDLDRIANLNAPRRIGLGEIACAVIAERENGGILCDDRRAHQWLASRVNPAAWELIEEFLLDAAFQGYLGEGDLWECQVSLERNQYRCQYDLRLEHVQRMRNRQLET